MIRRNLPLTRDDGEWLLVPQREHARVSGQLASAWGGPAAPPIVCDADSPSGPLRAAREETLQAIRLHDEGWADWDAAPGVDPAHARPYAFTEMPTADAQRIWSASIERCREVGPLAGWIVAGHFMALQSKADDDFAQWRPWLEEQQAACDAWLAEWLAQSAAYTEPLAQRAMFLLQTFDWLSLWLCCRAPLAAADAEATEPLELRDAQWAFGPYRFAPLGDSPGAVHVSPWPFTEPLVRVEAAGLRAPAAAYDDSRSLLDAARPMRLAWTLQDGPPAGADSP